MNWIDPTHIAFIVRHCAIAPRRIRLRLHLWPSPIIPTSFRIWILFSVYVLEYEYLIFSLIIWYTCKYIKQLNFRTRHPSKNLIMLSRAQYARWILYVNIEHQCLISTSFSPAFPSTTYLWRSEAADSNQGLPIYCV